MKRFVTYLYECQGGNKSKNVGFIRVNVRGENTTMEVYIRNIGSKAACGSIYALIYKEALVGLKLAELKIENGQSDTQVQMQTADIEDSGWGLDDIEGIGIRLDNGFYIASCWKDHYAEAIVSGDFRIKQEEACVVEEALLVAEESYEETVPMIRYEKIDLSQIRDLPSPNWHLATNSFLLHGFWNYGYLVLKEDLAENQKTYSLGVPGIFEKPEAVMAVLFGFPAFEEVASEVVDAEINQRVDISTIKKNQEPQTGIFGCWFVELQI